MPQERICPSCGKNKLIPWSIFKDNTLNKGVGRAMATSFVSGVKHMFLGEINIPQRLKHCKRTTDLYVCKNCDHYFIQCPVCRELAALGSNAPQMDKTIVQCKKCKSEILFAEEDYTLGGG